MRELGVAGEKPLSEHFAVWLEDEKKYLLNLSKEPLKETLELDYYRRLVSLNKISSVVHELEKELDIQGTWNEGNPDWIRVAGMANTQTYRRCLDKLEQLVISRVFELGKMNRSGTGSSIT